MRYKVPRSVLVGCYQFGHAHASNIDFSSGANKYPGCQKNASIIDFSSSQIQEHYPTINNNWRRKKLPHALIALNVQNLNALNTLNALIALNMSAEKLSSPRGDPGLLLCGRWRRPKKKKARYLVRPLGLKTVFMQTPRLS